MDWFLYDNGFRHESLNFDQYNNKQVSENFSDNLQIIYKVNPNHKVMIK